MYLILTTKPGQFKTEISDGLVPIESYDYIFYGRKRASFTIAEIKDPVRITIIEDAPPQIVNKVPSKLFEKFETLDQARHELHTLTSFGSMDISLRPA